MGVTGLWTVVAPTARPTQLATLNRKRLAVDASIWIYQFLKAVRDKEGNALRNSHVVGFFRRICKLLYFGIRPVFVFDGGAPALKRETVRGRARRREGRREDAVKTAGKLLGMQMQRLAEEEEREGRKKRAEKRERSADLKGDGREGVEEEEEEELPPEQDMVYVDEVGMSKAERRQNRGFRKKDQYHLPDLDTSFDAMGAPNDPRIMSQAELEEYARQFHRGEDINLYDFSKIDFESPFFLSLPATDRYNILNAARLRSRLRMGYSKEQLDDMFPDRMAFSRFQIERVRERNELTQRLMHVNGMADDYLHQGGRIAGEKGKEYMLVKNEGVEGGWALGVVSNKGGHEADAIDLDGEEVKEEADEEEDEEEGDEDFEDVAIEGLNRLPKKWARNRREVDYNPDFKAAAEEIAEKRRAVYEARRETAPGVSMQRGREPRSETDELFVRQTHHDAEDDGDELFEDVDMDRQEPVDEDEQGDLQRAIQMSLQTTGDDGDPVSNKGQAPPHGDGDGDRNDDGDESAFDLQAALAESRKSKYKRKDKPVMRTTPAQPANKGFQGPLPFESLNLGQSLLGKKKAGKIEEDQAGGFERETGAKKSESAPLPSWFAANDWSGNVRRGSSNELDEYDNAIYGREDVPRAGALMSNGAEKVIDVDALSQQEGPERIEIESSDSNLEAEADSTLGEADVNNQTAFVRDDDQVHNEGSDVGDQLVTETAPVVLAVNDKEVVTAVTPPALAISSAATGSRDLVQQSTFDPSALKGDDEENADNGHIYLEGKEFSEVNSQPTAFLNSQEQGSAVAEPEETEDVFEDVDVAPDPVPLLGREISGIDEAMNNQYLVEEAEASGGEDIIKPTDAADSRAVEQQDYMSDSDEELMRQMAIEAEEHARFTSSLHHNNNVQISSAVSTADLRDYERELKQLRNQQKKDRRDADEVTQVMVQECQALLRLFGLPYITAPMEAEAQCAELVHLGLVDGIVTDDSDIFLFGGTRIYKNMFNAAKFVECYLSSDLEKEYALDRAKLIRLAHLLGSDYTEGIAGIGPVTALEILTEFDSLENFRDWCTSIQMGQDPDTTNTIAAAAAAAATTTIADPGPGPVSAEQKTTATLRKKLKKQATKVVLPPSFPDMRVDRAYLQPEVDPDPSDFEWGVPDLDALRAFLMATIGWGPERTDEVLVPVIRDMNKRDVEGTQANITRFFGGGGGGGVGPRDNNDSNSKKNDKKTKKSSGRMERAFGRLRRETAKRKRLPDVDDAAEGGEEVEDDGGGDAAGDDGKRERRNPRVTIKARH